jgi:tRNA threonylcarbamoyladenosine biosynthesis protein TsaE
MEIHTKVAEDTKNFGREFANNLKGGEIIALIGDLGAGKTTFVQGLAEGIGIKEEILSPTFILMRQYELTSKYFYHVDLYRLEENLEEEMKKIGIIDLWGKPENIFVIEWADKARDIIPESAIWVNIEKEENDGRKITVTNN